MNKFDSAEYAWKDIEVVIMGRPLVRILGVEYTVKEEQSPIHGRGKKTLGIQSGNETVSGSLTIGQSELEALTRKAKEVNPRYKVTDLRFDINIVYRTEADTLITRDRVVSAKIKEYTKSMNQGDTDMEVKLPFDAVDVEESI